VTEAGGQDPTAIRIERTFAAPAKVVFDAWTSAEMLRRWYPPGADWETPIAEVDLRIGGRLRIMMRSPNGEEFEGGGEYREITEPSRLVFTWAWDVPDVAVGTQLVEVDFTEQPDGTTTVVMINRGLGDQQSRESHREGWEESFENLARLVCR
jgi:uncharacterized protein YndB with AHSA1/START domain